MRARIRVSPPDAWCNQFTRIGGAFLAARRRWEGLARPGHRDLRSLGCHDPGQPIGTGTGTRHGRA
jgi:hypothetical protein